MGVAEQLGHPAQLAHQAVGELLGQVHGLALSQVDQDLADDLGLLGQIDPGDDVGLVLLGRQRLGLGVGGLFRERVDRSAPNPRRIVVVGVQRDEEVARHAFGEAEPVAQADKDVLVPGQDHPVAPAGLELPPQRAGVGQCDVLFVDPGEAARSRVDAAMTGIDDDGSTLVGLGLGRHGDRAGGGIQRRIGDDRRGARGQEAGAADRHHVDHQAVGVIPGGRQHEDAADPGRRAEIEHHPAGPRREQTEAHGGDQAALLVAHAPARRPAQLGQVDHHAERVRQGEDPVARRLRKLHHEAGLVRVLADSHLAHHRLGPGGRGGRGRQGEAEGKQENSSHRPDCG